MIRKPRTVAAVTALALWLVPATAEGQSAAPKKGAYKGFTKQTSVLKSARAIEFKVKGKRISLTTEPAVARGFCISAPVFLLDVTEVTVKLSKRGRFSFVSTFFGSKTNRIKGAFDEKGTIEGEIVYHFPGSEAGLCSEGSTKTTFSARQGKKKKG